MTAEQPAPEIRILSGNPTPTEIAAVTAVLSTALEELAGQHRRSRETGPSAWDISRRGLRQPLPPGGWRNVVS